MLGARGARTRELVLAALDPELDRALVAADRRPPFAPFLAEPVEALVGVQRVVVEEDGALGAAALGEGERVGEGRVAPAQVFRVLGVGVLAVVDQQGGVACQLVAGDPALVERLEVGAQRRLVIGDVGERAVAVFDPVAERRATVGDRGGADPGRADLPLGLGAVTEGDVAGELADLDRRERRRDVAGDPIAQRVPPATTGPRSRSRSGAGRRGRRRRAPGCGRGAGG